MNTLDARGNSIRLTPKMIFGILVVILVGAGVLIFIQTARFTSWDFRNNLWAPSYLLVHGQSPYRITVLFDQSGAVWFPTAIGLFFPLGWLTQNQATNLWLVVNIAILILIVWLEIGKQALTPFSLAFGLGAVFLFPPVLSHLILGQFTIIAILLFVLADRLITTPSYWLAGFLVVAGLGKPQLGVLVLPGLLLAVWRVGRLRAVIIFVLAVIGSTIVLTLPLWIGFPTWFGDFIQAQTDNPLWAQPSVFSELRLQFGTNGVIIWVLLALGLFALNGWFCLKWPAQEALPMSLALTTLASPYTWSWDFVLLLPLYIHTFNHVRTRLSRVILGLGYILCWFLVVWVRLSTDNSDEYFWWVPFLMLMVVGGGYLSERLTSRTIN